MCFLRYVACYIFQAPPEGPYEPFFLYSSSSHRASIVIITLITFGFGFDFGVNDVVRHLLPDLGLCFDLVDARRPVDGKILLPGRRTVAGRGLHLGLQLDVARQVLNDLKIKKSLTISYYYIVFSYFPHVGILERAL